MTADADVVIVGRLARMCQTSTRDWEFLDAYAIPRALPVLSAGQRLGSHWCPMR